MNTKQFFLTAGLLTGVLIVLLVLITRIPSDSFRGGKGSTWPSGEKYLPLIPLPH